MRTVNLSGNVSGNHASGVPVIHPFDLEVGTLPLIVGLDLFAEESLEYQFQEAGCNNTFSTIATDCATTLSTIFCYGCDMGCGDGSC